MDRVLRHSASERLYLMEGVQSNLRNDGRTRLDYRYVSVDLGVAPQTNGSARLRHAETDIFVGVKCQIGEPNPSTPKVGKIEFSVQCCSSAAREFEGNGAELLNLDLTRMLERSMENLPVQWPELCLVEGHQVWVLNVDVMVLDAGGNLFDTIAMGVKAALHDTRIPKITVLSTAEGEVDLEVNDDPSESLQLSIEHVPLCVSLVKIGDHFLVDPSMEEELCMGMRLSVAVNKKGNVCSIQKAGGEGVDPIILSEMIQVAVKVGTTMHVQLDTLLAGETKHGLNDSQGLFG